MSRKAIKLRNAMKELHDELKKVKEDCRSLAAFMRMSYKDGKKLVNKAREDYRKEKLKLKEKDLEPKKSEKDSTKEEKDVTMCPEDEKECEEDCASEEECEKQEEDAVDEKLKQALEEDDYNELGKHLKKHVEKVPRSKTDRKEAAKKVLNEEE